MTNQEAFTRVVTHLREQGARAHSHERGVCVYRDPVTGRRCAVGVLITDEFYRASMEGATVPALKFTLEAALPGVSTELLMGLQRIHDAVPPPFWEASWEALAGLHGLIVPTRVEPTLTVEACANLQPVRN